MTPSHRNTNVLAELSALVHVVDAGSIAGAAQTLEVSPSALSRQLSRLEQRLGVTLLRRTTRSLSATEAGELLVRRAREALALIADAERHVRERDVSATGSLRVSAPLLFGEAVVSRAVARFCREQPQVTLDLRLSDDYVDLVRGRFDLAIRLGESLASSSLVARRIGEQESWLCAAPALFDGARVPRTPTELVAWPALELAHTREPDVLRLTHQGRQRRVQLPRRVLSNHLGALLSLARAGVGIASLPAYVVRPDVARGALLRLLPDWTLPRRSIWLVHAGGQKPSLAARRFADVLAAEASALADAPSTLRA